MFIHVFFLFFLILKSFCGLWHFELSRFDCTLLHSVFQMLLDHLPPTSSYISAIKAYNSTILCLLAPSSFSSIFRAVLSSSNAS